MSSQRQAEYCGRTGEAYQISSERLGKASWRRWCLRSGGCVGTEQERGQATAFQKGDLQHATKFGGQWRTIKKGRRGLVRLATWTDGPSCVGRMKLSGHEAGQGDELGDCYRNLGQRWWRPMNKSFITSFATPWVDLEIIILSEVSQTEKDKNHMISLIYGI